MVLIRAEALVPYGCTCDRSAAAKEDHGVRILAMFATQLR